MPSVSEVNEKEFNKKDISRAVNFKNVVLDVEEWINYVDGKAIRDGDELMKFSPKDMGYKKNKESRNNVKFFIFYVPGEDDLHLEHNGAEGVDFGRELIAATVREGQDSVKVRYERFLKEVAMEKDYLAEFGIKKFRDFGISRWDCNNGCEVVNEFEGLEYGEGVWDND